MDEWKDKWMDKCTSEQSSERTDGYIETRTDKWKAGEGACILDRSDPVPYTKLITLMRKVWGADLSHAPGGNRTQVASAPCIWKEPPGNLL